MNLTHISRRIEIGFWTALITLMKDKRAVRYITGAIILGLCLIVCITLVGAIQQGLQSLLSIGENPVQELPATGDPSVDGQQNTLFILVNQLESKKPDLLGVWVLVRPPSTPHLTWLPVYPVYSETVSDPDNSLATAFRLNREKAPVERFLKKLRSKGLWWDEYLVIDETGLEGLIELAGGVDMGEGILRGAEIEAYLALNSDDPRDPLVTQSRLAWALCQDSYRIVQTTDPAAVYLKIKDHLSTNIGIETLVGNWYTLHHFNLGVSCEFPTLQQAMDEQRAPQTVQAGQ